MQTLVFLRLPGLLGFQRLHTEPVEDEWYITTDHPMTKTEHIAFAALLSGGSLRVWRQYPEWDFQLRLSRREHGLLVWYRCV